MKIRNRNQLYVCKCNLQLAELNHHCVFIADIYNSGESLKLWVGMADLYFQCHHIIVDGQKQYNNWGFVDVEC